MLSQPEERILPERTIRIQDQHIIVVKPEPYFRKHTGKFICWIMPCWVVNIQSWIYLENTSYPVEVFTRRFCIGQWCIQYRPGSGGRTNIRNPRYVLWPGTRWRHLFQGNIVKNRKYQRSFEPQKRGWRCGKLLFKDLNVTVTCRHCIIKEIGGKTTSNESVGSSSCDAADPGSYPASGGTSGDSKWHHDVDRTWLWAASGECLLEDAIAAADHVSFWAEECMWPIRSRNLPSRRWGVVPVQIWRNWSWLEPELWIKKMWTKPRWTTTNRKGSLYNKQYEKFASL